MELSDKPREDRFVSLQWLFWRVLSTLARHGYVAPPEDARELIHDFYVDAWPGVLERYDPSRASFEVYVASAFYKFARRRIVSLQQLRTRTVDLEAVSELISNERTPVERLEDSQLLEAVSAALNSLPPAERAALYEFASNDRPSERAIARRLGMSRYALRETLSEALGRFAVALGRTSSSDVLEARVAESLWSEGRSLRNTAAYLGVDLAKVKTAKQNFIAGLLNALRYGHHLSLPKEPNMTEYLELLQRAIYSPGDHGLLEHIRELSPAILDALHQEDAQFLPTPESGERLPDREWAATVYAVLSGGDSDVETTPMAVAMAHLRSQDDVQAGEALAALVHHHRFLASWDRYFELRITDMELVAFLSRDESVEAAGYIGRGLVRIGMTPAMFVQAAHGFELLFNRLSRHSQLNGNQQRGAEDNFRLEIGLRIPHQGTIPVPDQLLVAQARNVTHLPFEHARGMARWIKDAATVAPFIVGNYFYEERSGCFEPCQAFNARDPLSLMRRWTEVRDEQAAARPTAHHHGFL